MGMIPRFNLNDINGIFAYSAISGLVLSIWISAGIDISDAGILTNILQVLANNLDYPFSYVGIIAIPFTVIEIIIIIHSVRQIPKRGYPGIIASATGFFGVLITVTGAAGIVPGATYAGVAILLAGAITCGIRARPQNWRYAF